MSSGLARRLVLTVVRMLSGFLCDFLEERTIHGAPSECSVSGLLVDLALFVGTNNAHDAVCLIGNRRASSLLLQLLHLSPCHPSRLGSCLGVVFCCCGRPFAEGHGHKLHTIEYAESVCVIS